MVFKRKTFKRKAKRTFKRKAKGRRSGFKSSSVKGSMRALSWRGCPFPQILKTQFTFSENITLVATLGISQNYTYNANSLFDPNAVLGGTNQPRFYDTLCGANNTGAPYHDYCVYKSKMSIVVMSSTNDTNTARACIGIGTFVTGTSGASSLAELMERRDYSKKFLGMSLAGHDMVKLSRSANMAAINGIKDLQDDPGSKAEYNASPSNIVFFNINCIPVDEATTVTYRCIVRITYYCYLYARNDVSNS